MAVTPVSTTTMATTQAPESGMSGWAVAAIIFAILVRQAAVAMNENNSQVLIAALGAGAFFLYRRVREQRRNHGEYRPQLEENMHAKNLPYITPPNIEGLM